MEDENMEVEVAIESQDKDFKRALAAGYFPSAVIKCVSALCSGQLVLWKLDHPYSDHLEDELFNLAWDCVMLREAVSAQRVCDELERSCIVATFDANRVPLMDFSGVLFVGEIDMAAMKRCTRSRRRSEAVPVRDEQPAAKRHKSH